MDASHETPFVIIDTQKIQENLFDTHFLPFKKVAKRCYIENKMVGTILQGCWTVPTIFYTQISATLFREQTNVTLYKVAE
ncbi:hypothetical protein LRA02_14610 [Lentilactobacillus rapi]|uniref:Uncharacterized protein n=1 Tax=Lentilactobacillus rapi TaxID=481723 RepID=A0A512PN47_9LACO|nr:hypothetical protein LRA02_14610 [Lentilactobacillus rapi]